MAGVYRESNDREAKLVKRMTIVQMQNARDREIARASSTLKQEKRPLITELGTLSENSGDKDTVAIERVRAKIAKLTAEHVAREQKLREKWAARINKRGQLEAHGGSATAAAGATAATAAAAAATPATPRTTGRAPATHTAAAGQSALTAAMQVGSAPAAAVGNTAATETAAAPVAATATATTTTTAAARGNDTTTTATAAAATTATVTTAMRQAPVPNPAAVLAFMDFQ